MISYRLTVRDNKDPFPNKAETAYQVIEVTEPASPEQKKEIEEKQTKQAEQLDPPQQQPADVAPGDNATNPPPAQNPNEDAKPGTSPADQGAE